MTLTQINKAGLDELALDHVFTIGASGTDHYTFQGEGLNGTVNDPTLYLVRGKTYRFENGTGGHPIRIQSTSGASGTAYNTGVTNNASAGTVIVEVQHDSPDVLYYQCTSHANMGGILYTVGALADGGVTTAKLADDAVTTAKIADNAVTFQQLSSNTVKTGNIEGGAVTTDRIADDAVTQAKIAAGAVNTTELADNAVNSSKLASNSVTGTQILSNAVTAAKIAAGEITNTHIGTGAINGDRLTDETVTLAKLPHGDGSSDGKFLRANNGADPTFESLPSSGATLSGSTNNTVVTVTGSNAMQGEANVQIDSNGRLLIGTTTAGESNGDEATFANTGGNAGITIRSAVDSECKIYFSEGTSGGSQYRGAINYNQNTNYMAFSANENERMRILGAGGITFNGDTAAANALDDYEEGTWSPGINTGTANFSGSNYTKIGRMVTATTFVAQMSPRSSGSGIQITNLPFSCNGVHIASIGLHRVIGDQGNGYFGYVSAGVNFIDLLQYPWSQQGWKALPHTAIQHATAAYIIVTITYSTS